MRDKTGWLTGTGDGIRMGAEDIDVVGGFLSQGTGDI